MPRAWRRRCRCCLERPALRTGLCQPCQTTCVGLTVQVMTGDDGFDEVLAEIEALPTYQEDD